MNKRTLRIVSAIAGLVAAAAFAGSLQASAVNADDARALAVVQPSPNTVGSGELKNGGVFGWDMADNTIPWLKMGSQLRGEIRAAQAPITTARLANGAVTQGKLEAGLSNKIDAALSVPTNDKVDIAPATIAKIGGSFATRATKIGEFNLTEGTWDVRTRMRADRVNTGTADYVTPTTDTMPMLALRINGDGWVDDLGTIMGSQISRAGRVELTGSDVVSYTVPDNTTYKVEVYGFGYNEDTSAFGSDDYPATEGKPQFTIGAQIRVFKFGH